ncbi:MAG TPA: hypothetical protein VH142_16685 [Polyangiaceae bacterium]|jgi:hypothetical protein|nr:hypothetical protein [Polyangiaceae bacterium]
MPSNRDDSDRGVVGVVCSIVVLPSGAIELVLDDVECAGTSFPREWKTTHSSARNNYGRREFMNVELSERQFADIGLNVAIRLAALAGAKKRITSR